jgi:hypothetical protein
MQLTEEQLRAAVRFYERAAALDEEKAEEKEVLDGLGADDGYWAETCEEGAVLLSCADGNEVDTVALAVFLLAHQSRDDDCWLELDGHGFPNGPAYRASLLIEEDPGVSYVWKGLLGWQDVERLQVAL